MNHKCKRLTALILALSMCLSLLSATAWAADVSGGYTDDAIAAETEGDVSAVEVEDESEEEADTPAEEEEPEAESVEEPTREQRQEGAGAAEGAAAESEEAEEAVEEEASVTVSAQSTVASGTCGDNLTWTLDDAGTLTISGTGAMTDWEEEESTPWDEYYYDIERVVIGDGVTSIGDRAFFYRQYLTSVDIPDSVTSIGDSAFLSCIRLTSVDFGSGVTSIGDYAFYNCRQLQSIDLPDSMNTIGESAFHTCNNLTSADLGGTTVIGDSAFYGCLELSSVTWYNVTSIGAYAFYETSLNGSFTLGKGVTYIGDYALGYLFEDWPYEDIIIYGYSGTVGETYANENGFTFVDLEPAAPTLSSVSNTTSGVKITWEAVSGVTGYRVYRKAAGDSSWTNIKSSTTSTSYTDTTAKSGTTYYYTVRAYVKAGTGNTYWGSYNTTGLKIAFLSAPTLSSVSNTTSGVKVSWGKVTGAAKYRVFRKTGSGSWTKLTDTTSTSYTDTTAKSGTTYKYTVRCINSAGTSYTSSYNTTGLTIKYLTAGKVSTLTNTSSGITVKWSKVTGASGYRIYRKTSGGSYSLIKTVTSASTVSYTDTAVKSKNGTTYVYAVRPYSGSYTGSYTGKTTVRLTAVSISSLTNVKTKKMTVKWGKNTKATGYEIQYSTSSSFSSGNKTAFATSASTVSKTISSLTKGKKYYVRVRAYKTVSGTSYYSAWSGAKSVKISK